jgi:hypothetical protein
MMQREFITRRGGSKVAARGARAAGRADAAHRHTPCAARSSKLAQRTVVNGTRTEAP